MTKGVLTNQKKTWLPFAGPFGAKMDPGIKLRGNFSQQVLLYRMQRTLIWESAQPFPADHAHNNDSTRWCTFFLEILSQNAMTCAKLKQLSITRHGTHEGFQWIGGSFIHTTSYKWWNSVSDFHMVFYNLMLHIIN